MSSFQETNGFRIAASRRLRHDNRQGLRPRSTRRSRQSPFQPVLSHATPRKIPQTAFCSGFEGGGETEPRLCRVLTRTSTLQERPTGAREFQPDGQERFPRSPTSCKEAPATGCLYRSREGRGAAHGMPHDGFRNLSLPLASPRRGSSQDSSGSDAAAGSRTARLRCVEATGRVPLLWAGCHLTPSGGRGMCVCAHPQAGPREVARPTALATAATQFIASARCGGH